MVGYLVWNYGSWKVTLFSWHGTVCPHLMTPHLQLLCGHG